MSFMSDIAYQVKLAQEELDTDPFGLSGTVFVAGGALRDIAQGIDPKDIDVFVIGDISEVELVAECFGLESAPELIDHGNAYEASLEDDAAQPARNITRVIEFTPEGGYTINVIGVAACDGSPMAVIEQFDIYNCQVALTYEDGAAKVQWTPEYAQATKDKVFRVNTHEFYNRFDRGCHRAISWLQRPGYKDFMFEMPTWLWNSCWKEHCSLDPDADTALRNFNMRTGNKLMLISEPQPDDLPWCL